MKMDPCEQSVILVCTSPQQCQVCSSRMASKVNHEERVYGGQGIEDVEDTKDGVAMHFQELSDLCEKVRANVDAIHVCKCYYMSHAYREVRHHLAPSSL